MKMNILKLNDTHMYVNILYLIQILLQAYKSNYWVEHPTLRKEKETGWYVLVYYAYSPISNAVQWTS